MAALYVMQSEVGLIKIGRSFAPEKRRRNLEREHRCRINLVVELQDQGDDEETILIALEKFCVGDPRRSEWFDGSERCRKAILRLLGLKQLEWPYALNEDAAEKWCADFEQRQIDSYHRTSERRTLAVIKVAALGLIKSFEHGHVSLDARIVGELTGHTVGMGGPEGAYYFEGTGRQQQRIPVPPFTRDMSAAMTLWTSPEAGASWLNYSGQNASPLACCLAALAAVWQIDLDRLAPRLGW